MGYKFFGASTYEELDTQLREWVSDFRNKVEEVIFLPMKDSKEHIGLMVHYKATGKSEVLESKNPDKSPKCSECGATMIIRKNRENGDRFWGCPRYKKGCVGKTQPFTEQDSIVHLGDGQAGDLRERVVDAGFPSALVPRQPPHPHPQDDDIPF